METNSPNSPPRGVELQQTLIDLFERYADSPEFVLAPLVSGIVLGTPTLDWWLEAGREFRARLDAETWPNGAPWTRRRTRDGIDFALVNALALDRLKRLLKIILPEGYKGTSHTGAPAWIGWHPDRQIKIAVDYLSGAWDELDTGRGGTDLISLTAHVAGLSQGQAARWLSDWMGTKGRRHA